MHSTGFVILIWLLNFGLSIWNAYAVGLAWVETKHSGGWPRVTAWAGAVMSASGFSWCYLLILTYAAYGLDWLDWGHVEVALKMGYVVLIPGILIAGMIITLDSWARTYRQRTLANIGSAAWNTYAQIHNTFNAISDLDKAFGGVIDAIPSEELRRVVGQERRRDRVHPRVPDRDLRQLLSGILTTAVIIYRVAGNTKLPEEIDVPSEK